jgi:hypothetical protein
MPSRGICLVPWLRRLFAEIRRMDLARPHLRRLVPSALLVGVVVALYLLLNGLWLEADRLVFDGDEAGHVGAAELLAALWREGRLGEALGTTLAGRMGVYPPLYAGVVGAWWALWGLGDPTAVVVQGLNLLWPVLAALAVARLARPLGPRPMLAALLAVLALPLLCGLGRHFMLEGALAAAVAWAVVALESARARPTALRMALLGLALGLAYLVKQTAPLYLLPVVVLRLPRRANVLVALGVAALLAAPWTFLNLEQQLGYGGESAAGTPGIALLWHLGFYPWSLLWVAAGPALVALGLAGVVAGWRSQPPQREGLWIAAAWLVGSLLLLCLVPRKYPRLLAPALPALGLWVALAFARWRRGWRAWALGLGLLGAVGWTAAGSLWRLPVPDSARVLDDRCPQVWLRPPSPVDLGLAQAVHAVRHSRPGPVRVVGDLEIPCALQTTHAWSAHIGPALRFAGVDRNLAFEGDEPSSAALEPAALVLSWEGPVEGYQGEPVRFPGLEASLWIGRPVR